MIQILHKIEMSDIETEMRFVCMNSDRDRSRLNNRRDYCFLISLLIIYIVMRSYVLYTISVLHFLQFLIRYNFYIFYILFFNKRLSMFL